MISRRPTDINTVVHSNDWDVEKAQATRSSVTCFHKNNNWKTSKWGIVMVSRVCSDEMKKVNTEFEHRVRTVAPAHGMNDISPVNLMLSDKNVNRLVLK
jgi:hypothetical protein